jgi:hypothetical protein
MPKMKNTSRELQEIGQFSGYKRDRRAVILEQLEGFSDFEKSMFLPVFLSIGAEILDDCKKCMADAKMAEFAGLLKN